MTVLQKKAHNPIGHLTPEDIEEIGRRLDAIRAEFIAARGASDAAYSR
jgi:linoleoyl-CoA desaturase